MLLWALGIPIGISSGSIFGLPAVTADGLGRKTPSIAGLTAPAPSAGLGNAKVLNVPMAESWDVSA